MILHFSHIGLTDGRTFMIPFGSVISDPALAAVKGRRYRSPTRAHAFRRAPRRRSTIAKGCSAAAVRRPPSAGGRCPAPRAWSTGSWRIAV